MVVAIDVAAAQAIYDRLQAGTGTAADLALRSSGRALLQANSTWAAVMAAIATASVGSLATRRASIVTGSNSAKTALDDAMASIAAQRASATAGTRPGLGDRGIQVQDMYTDTFCHGQQSDPTNFHPNVTVDLRDEYTGYDYHVMALSYGNGVSNGALSWQRRNISTGALTTILNRAVLNNVDTHRWPNGIYCLPVRRQGDTPAQAMPCLVFINHTDNWEMYIIRYDGTSTTEFKTPTLQTPASYLIYDSVEKVLYVQNKSANRPCTLYSDAMVQDTTATINLSYNGGAGDYTQFNTTLGRRQRYMGLYSVTNNTTPGASHASYWKDRLECVTEPGYPGNPTENFSSNYAWDQAQAYFWDRVGHTAWAKTIAATFPGRGRMGRNPHIVRTGQDTFQVNRFLYYARMSRGSWDTHDTNGTPVPDVFFRRPEEMVWRYENAETGALISCGAVPVSFSPGFTITANASSPRLCCYVPVHYNHERHELTFRAQGRALAYSGANDFQIMWDDKFLVY